MSDEREAMKAAKESLLIDAEHERTYLTDASFHHGFDLAWQGALEFAREAAEAERDQARIQRDLAMATSREAERLEEALSETKTALFDVRLAAGRREGELEAALPDPEKLELIAAWLDRIDDQRGEESVHGPQFSANDGESPRQAQVDLRAWAASARAALTPGEDSEQ